MRSAVNYGLWMLVYTATVAAISGTWAALGLPPGGLRFLLAAIAAAVLAAWAVRRRAGVTPLGAFLGSAVLWLLLHGLMAYAMRHLSLPTADPLSWAEAASIVLGGWRLLELGLAALLAAVALVVLRWVDGSGGATGYIAGAPDSVPASPKGPLKEAP